MHFDYALILTALTLLTAIAWVIDRFARRRRAEPARGLDRVTETFGSFFPILLLVLVFRSFLFEPFKIPSGSMIPTLLIGDFIVVNKFSYGLRLPVVNKRFISTGEPQRGDVMVFRFPPDERINYIKRVIGLPGDTITYRNKMLFVNGEIVPQEQQSLWLGQGRNRDNRGLLHTEQLADVAHSILINPNRPPGDTLTFTVPEGQYFAMGDNRDASSDSRDWGFVPEQNLVGRATRIWMHWDCSRGCVVFDRIGAKID